jgi:putative aminopeptidase FrvX
MNKENLGLLKTILSLPSPSSHESAIRDLYINHFSGKNISVGKDVLGNASVALLGRMPGTKIMLSAHMDEVGFVILAYNDDGSLRVGTLGSIDPCMVVGSCVDIHTKRGVVTGIFGRRPVHEIDEGLEERLDIAEMFIDIGSFSQEETKKKVNIGDFAVWKPHMYKFSKDIFSARGVDDRIGVYILIRVMDNLLESVAEIKTDNSIFSVLTAMEELVEADNAAAAAAKIGPGISIILETHECSDYPDSTTKDTNAVVLSGGPVLDIGIFTNRKLNEFIALSAEKLGIQLQLCLSNQFTCTTLDEIRRSAGGVACSLLSIPVRYLHSPSSLFNIKAVEAAVALITHVCQYVNTVDTFVP